MASEGLQRPVVIADQLQNQDKEQNGEQFREGASPDEIDVKEISELTTFPEGGARAWAVAAGAAGVLFCTLGYSNAFG